MEITKENHYFFSKIETDLKLTIPGHVKNILWFVFKENFGFICYYYKLYLSVFSIYGVADVIRFSTLTQDQINEIE